MKLLSRLAAIALTVSVPLVLVLAGLQVWQGFRALEEDAADLLAQRQAFAERRTRAQAPRPIEVAEDALIDAGSEALAAVAIQDMVARAAAAADARLDSRRVDPAIPLDPWRKLPMTIDVTVAEGQLHVLLHALEVQRPYLFIERLDIRPAGRGQDDAPPVLGLRIVLYGLMPPG